ncbi:MAG: deoxyribonuclease IV [Spirochaetota bacterium]
MKYIGPHVSSAGGVENSPLNAGKVGAKAFALFTKNQRQWVAPPLSEKSRGIFRDRMEQYGYSARHVLPHCGYLINIGNPFKEKRQKSLQALIDDIERVHLLGLETINFHPGSHLKEINEEECIRLIAETMNTALDKTEGVTLVVETTAGQGSNIGYTFEQLASIIEQVKDKSRVGVCLDTCHIFAAGYDIRTKAAYDTTMKSFERIIGFTYLKGLHVNDAKSVFGSRVDRHEQIGKGNLGLQTFQLFMQDKRFDDIPIIIETKDEELWPEEIKLLYSLEQKKH